MSELGKLTVDLSKAVALVQGVSARLVAIADTKPQVSAPWSRDIRQELAFNPGPYTHPALQKSDGWWRRTLDQIDGVTVHHTLSDSPHATAEHYVTKGGGRPSIPYTIWVSQTGEVLLCVALEWGLWHDHTGHENTHLSVGLAGHLHKHYPAEAQLDAAARVCAWAIKELPGVRGIDDVRGHRDHVATVCPGWDAWRDDFYERLKGETDK